MQFTNSPGYREVGLFSGLCALERNSSSKLYSDGLEENEYMYYDLKRGICYEDNAIIEATAYDAVMCLNTLSWVHEHKFYLCEE